MRTNYQRGVALEYAVKKKLLQYCYYVIRSAGSHTAIDLLASNGDRVLAIQCKRGNSPFRETDRINLIKWAQAFHGFPILVTRIKWKNKVYRTNWKIITEEKITDEMVDDRWLSFIPQQKVLA